MAKGNLFQGMGRGKIGDVVFSRLNGQQLSRVRNRNPKNPRSNAQLYQRAIMATIMQAYSAGKKIFDHSFQGVAVGANNMAVFMRENLKILRQQIAYEISSEMLAENMQANCVWPGANQPVANAYLISKGNYKQKAFIETRPGGGIYYTLPEPETNEKVNEYASRVGLLADDYYTFCLFLEGTNELFHAFEGLEDPAGIGYDCRFGYVRLHVKSNVASIEDAIATKSQLFDVDASMNIDETFMTENVAEGISMSDLDVTGRGVGSIGLIRSRKDRDLRSTSYMYCPTKAQQETNDFGIKAIYINEAWARGTESLGNSDLILEGGGGTQPAPAPTIAGIVSINPNPPYEGVTPISIEFTNVTTVDDIVEHLKLTISDSTAYRLQKQSANIINVFFEVGGSWQVAYALTLNENTGALDKTEPEAPFYVSNVTWL